MKGLLHSVADLVERVSLNTFFYIILIDESMKCLPEDICNFTLELAETEGSSLLVQPEPELIGVGEYQRDSAASVKASFESYDEYQK